MKKIALTLSLLAVLVAAAIVACQDLSGKSPATGSNNTPDSAALVVRGEYLVTSMLCDDCHSPKSMGPMGPEIIPELRLSGRPAGKKLPAVDTSEIRKGFILFDDDLTAAVGPWGASFSGNLTSDSTGIGMWTYEQFKRAFTTGKYKGLETGRDLLPPMPWPQFRNMDDKDIRAIFAYLKATKPVKNLVPAPIKFSALQ